MSKVLKVIGNILLVLFIVVAAAQLVPPLVGVTTVVATPQVESNMQVGSVAYGWRKNLNTAATRLPMYMKSWNWIPLPVK